MAEHMSTKISRDLRISGRVGKHKGDHKQKNKFPLKQRFNASTNMKNFQRAMISSNAQHNMLETCQVIHGTCKFLDSLFKILVLRKLNYLQDTSEKQLIFLKRKFNVEKWIL